MVEHYLLNKTKMYYNILFCLSSATKHNRKRKEEKQLKRASAVAHCKLAASVNAGRPAKFEGKFCIVNVTSYYSNFIFIW
jgi:hypothetical protein